MEFVVVIGGALYRVTKDPKSEKWMLTINNPLDKGFTHDRITDILTDLKCTYYVGADEIGLTTNTFHTHIFLYRENSVIRFSTLKKAFPEAHIEKALKGAENCRNYVLKSGKYKNDKKQDTHIKDSEFEYGECPQEKQGYRTDLIELYKLIEDGLSDKEILEQDPTVLVHLDKLDKVRQIILEEKYKSEWRNLHVTYIWGSTGTGKTRSVMEEYGYTNVYRVTNYFHPFDFYHGEDVLLFEEFRSSLKIQDMLNYLDGYPLKLPARFSDRQACYTKVFICTNIPLSKQYPKIQQDEKETYKAFCRRIHEIKCTDEDENGFMKISKEEYEQLKLDFGFNEEYL